ncbi:MAG: NUDIX domain-containing protein [Desulfovibrionaceae bacterium]|nr:NUDIX domain-containing protein [Desulfovibrionaceae bacterium]MBF0514072.1 NUDIX domain-containing protein [Desulfovibrionaceae bacterium]
MSPKSVKFPAVSSRSGAEPVTVVDGRDRPLAVMPLAEVHRQKLYHRCVLVLVYDREHRLYLQRRAKSKSAYPGCFDLSATGHVQAFESREDAGIRELSEELGLTAARLARLASFPASPQTAFEFSTLFSAGRIQEEPRPNPEELDGGFFAGREDVEDLVEHFRDLLTPALLHCHEAGLLFSR